ncbi:MAG: hypothetical protein HN509_00115 [Halobacteriovoraceae bacterium]|jgi:hypothetical protein|nr:hypothetical protein [Halobacteriovoraceae bacterium]
MLLRLQLELCPDHHIFTIHNETPSEEHFISFSEPVFLSEFADLISSSLKSNKNVLIYAANQEDLSLITELKLKKYHFYFDKNRLIYFSKALKNRVPIVNYTSLDFNELGQYLDSQLVNT